MNKKSFLAKYRKGKHPLITTHFNEDYFLNSPNLRLTRTKKKLKDFLSFYHPWHHKKSLLGGSIEDILKDRNYRTLKLGEPIHPANAKTHKEIARITKNFPKRLWPIPIAKDITLKKTLLLDSNRTIRALLARERNLRRKIPVAEIRGPHLSKLTTDFKVIARQS